VKAASTVHSVCIPVCGTVRAAHCSAREKTIADSIFQPVAIPSQKERNRRECGRVSQPGALRRAAGPCSVLSVACLSV
jgi:hypothetical protein